MGFPTGDEQVSRQLAYLHFLKIPVITQILPLSISSFLSLACLQFQILLSGLLSLSSFFSLTSFWLGDEGAAGKNACHGEWSCNLLPPTAPPCCGVHRVMQRKDRWSPFLRDTSCRWSTLNLGYLPWVYVWHHGCGLGYAISELSYTWCDRPFLSFWPDWQSECPFLWESRVWEGFSANSRSFGGRFFSEWAKDMEEVI